MHTVFALLCFVVVIHWLIFPYPSGLLHWHCGNLTIAPVPAKQPWWIWRNTSCEFIMNDCITTTNQSTTKPCAYFLGYTVTTQIDISLHLFCHFPRFTCVIQNLWKPRKPERNNLHFSVISIFTDGLAPLCAETSTRWFPSLGLLYMGSVKHSSANTGTCSSLGVYMSSHLTA